MLHASVSVGRRLAVLVVAEAVTALFLLGVGIVALARIALELDYERRFIIAPLEGMMDAGAEADRVALVVEASPNPSEADWRALEGAVDRARSYIATYRREWALAGNRSRDAERQRAELARAGRQQLESAELAALIASERLLDRLAAKVPRAARGGSAEGIRDDLREARAALRELHRVDLAFLKVANDTILEDVPRTKLALAAAGLGGVFLASILGLRVRRAIAPRLRRLVAKVRTFQERGLIARTDEPGHDEIAVLANALDSGLEAIAAREKERERFIAVAAHELKTPITSLAGFAEVALSNPTDARLRDRALDVVRRQTSRLARLVDDLLLAARARSDSLRFAPRPIDLVTTIRQVAYEVAAELPDRQFALDLPPTAPLLADEALIAQAISNVMTYSAAVTAREARLPIRMLLDATSVRLRAELPGATIAMTEVEQAFSPFGSVQYEGATARNAVGLYLAREIARLHGGTVRVHEADDGSPASLELEVPR